MGEKFIQQVYEVIARNLQEFGYDKSDATPGVVRSTS